jgi:hypothetical protein
MPFDPAEPIVELTQISRNAFRLRKGFAYVDSDGERYEITPEGVGDTDLASVPWILWWFVASYGRHTRPALVHDQLVDQIERHKADTVFRHALREVGIGWVHRWLVWTAVSLETTFRTWRMPEDPARPGVRSQRKGRLVSAVGFLIVGLHLALIGVAVAFAVRGSSLWWIVATVLAIGWFAIWRLRGVIAAPGAVLVVPATVAVLIPSLIAWILEGGLFDAAKLIVWWLVLRRSGAPRPGVRPIGPTRELGINT